LPVVNCPESEIFVINCYKKAANVDLFERFPIAWCPACEKLQPLILEVLKAGGKNGHDSVDILCDECMSVLVNLHGRRAN
jgi:hypothetical protein